MNSLKIRYFYRHLIISILIVGSVTYICQLIWFPSPFIELDGTWRALLVLIGVDITLGPLLTLILVNSSKSKFELRLDMLVIVLLQASALIFGLSKIEQERVWAIVHYDGAFHSITKKDISESEYKTKLNLPQFQKIYFAMILEKDVNNHTKQESTSFLFSPTIYKNITKEEIEKQSFSYDNLPEYIQNKYQNKYIFKGLAGKKRNAALVFNPNMKLIDIVLLPEQSEPENISSNN
ncbi:hypothetical protein [Litorilituus lipolyticus]|uniref:Type IV pilin accessory protein n=1 Tax=Litorilituus lipolyticus TaxID=2491017 RepID=A0A502KKH1_9GAMM|nr:hypothetical protein [Litorilituus lipolyticus]TPH12052.1 hypothetical protein EPA86_16955 [Litorilituus lipolyticus]